MKTVQKCTYNYINADVIEMKSYMKKIKWNKELQNRNMKCGVHLQVFLTNVETSMYQRMLREERKTHVDDGQCSTKSTQKTISNMTYTRR